MFHERQFSRKDTVAVYLLRLRHDRQQLVSKTRTGMACAVGSCTSPHEWSSVGWCSAHDGCTMVHRAQQRNARWPPGAHAHRPCTLPRVLLAGLLYFKDWNRYIAGRAQRRLVDRAALTGDKRRRLLQAARASVLELEFFEKAGDVYHLTAAMDQVQISSRNAKGKANCDCASVLDQAALALQILTSIRLKFLR